MMEESKRFLKIARKSISDFHEDRVCPDQIVGEVQVSDAVAIGLIPEIVHEKTKRKDFKKREYLRRNRDNPTLIILVLESPHIWEYKEKSPKPAAGSTGRAIRKLFSEACPLHFGAKLQGIYSLAIMNAIPYQCSLGNIEQYRDKVFRECWWDFGKVGLLRRLEEIGIIEEDIIINACTKGKSKPELRECVNDAIMEFTNKVSCNYARVNHPASWIRTKNRASKNKTNPEFGWEVYSK